MKKTLLALTIIVLVSVPFASLSDACSRVLWNNNGNTIVTARSMDWQHKFDDYLFVNSRGQEMDGGVKNPAQWVSKYGNINSSVIGYAQKYGFDFVKDGGTDGINEKGLAAHLLYLEETVYPEVDKRPGVSYLRWVRYVLDNFATVEEAVEGMKEVRIAPVKLGGKVLGTHMAIEDSSGDSAIFEFIGGRLQVHHGKQHTVMTNDPAYPKQLELLKQFEGFGGSKRLPGTTASEDRFARLSYYLKYLPEPQDDAEAVASIHSLIMNAAVPFGAPYGDGVYPTWWTSATDVTNKVYYFNWVKNPNIIWIELNKLDFSEGKPVLVLNPRNPSLVGDVSRSFEPVK